jgi:hypothetical protein
MKNRHRVSQVVSKLICSTGGQRKLLKQGAAEGPLRPVYFALRWITPWRPLSATQTLLAPEILERLRTQFRIASRMLYVAMAKPKLQPPGVVASIRQ